jgi:predicted phosphoribosyltransferase
MIFADRGQAGQTLADQVVRQVPASRLGRPLVLALPRGGVPVAVPVAGYELTDELDLSALQPLIAMPRSPGIVVPVREVAGRGVSGADRVGQLGAAGLRDGGGDPA